MLSKIDLKLKSLTLIKMSNLIVPIKIQSYQIDHLNRVCNILHHHHCYVDTSRMGSGKTIIAIAVAQKYGLSLIVVCPVSTSTKWQAECAKYGVKLITTISYASLRGSKKYVPTHGLLIRREDDYTVTEDYLKYVQAGILLVFDEVQNVKNDNAQLHAAHCLVTSLVSISSSSRIALLSETLCDQIKCSESLLKIMGIITKDKLYRYDQNLKLYEPEGIDQVINKAKSLDLETTNKILKTFILDKKTASPLCYDLYDKVIKHYLSSSMSLKYQTKEIIITKDACNGYYEMEPNDIELLHKGVSLLARSTRYREDTGTVDLRLGNWGEITQALIMIEQSKVNVAIRLVKQDLLSNPDCKVILYFNFIEDMKTLCDKLSEFNPLLMYGQTKLKKRDQIIQKFQSDNNDYRLLISNARVGGVGIDLDDHTGNHPRFMYIIPSYNFIELHQATGRVFRNTTKSSPKIRFIYSKQYPKETSIINALSRKAEVTRNMSYDPTDNKFPDDYSTYIEGYDEYFPPLKANKSCNDATKLNDEINCIKESVANI